MVAAQRLYRKARETSNSFLQQMVLDLTQNSVQKGAVYQTRLEQAQESAEALQQYLDGSQCDGTMTQAKFLPAIVTTLLPKLPSLISYIRGISSDRKEAGQRRMALAASLREMRWAPYPEIMGGIALAGPTGPAGTLPPPVLRLETGLHMAAIRALSVSADGRLALTASEDKSARLWDPATGRLLRVIRPAVEDDKAGMLYACALAPDGNLAALGGWTRSARDGSHRILLVDTRTGNLVRSLEVGPQVVNFLAFSPDGQRLAAHLGGTSGLRMFRTQDGTLLAQDQDYSQPTYRGAFDAKGRYAVSCDDGFLRLYDAACRLAAKVKAPAEHPFGLAFSPDGARLAVAYAESPRLDVLDAGTLGMVFTPKAGSSKLGLAAWSWDGQTLYASGGEDFGPAPNVLRSWAKAGHGVAQETALACATVSELLVLPDGGLAYAAQDPAWGVCEASGAVRFRKAIHPGDLRAARRTFRIDALATRVSLPGRIPDFPEAAFSVPDLDLVAQAPLGEVGPASTMGLEVTGWEDGLHPAFQGQPLILEPFETSRSLGRIPGGNGFLLGTDWNLRAYDAQGLRWKHPTPAAVWGLAARQDGQVAAALLADGTIRWYRLRDGVELLGLYVAADRRWIAWTPSGAFAASPGGETLAGWQINRTDQTGDFFPLSQFRDRFYQPGLLLRVLETLDENAARQRLPGGAPTQGLPITGEFPPVATILPPEGDRALPPGPATFQVELRSLGPARAVKGFQVFLDGRRMPLLRDLRPWRQTALADGESRIYQVTVNLPPRDVTVEILAELENGQLTEHASRTVRVDAPPNTTPVPPALPVPPTLRVLSVGIQRFANLKSSLQFTVKDANDLAQVFRDQEGKLYQKVEVTMVVDEQATAKALLEAMDRIQSAARPDDVTLFFFSTHGSNTERSSYALVSYDFGQGMWGVDGAAIKARLEATQGKVVLLLDTCHSGNVMGPGAMRGLDQNIQRTRFINELIQAGPGMVVLSSSSGAQYSMESPAWNNGAFTKALREGLAGAADTGHTGRVTTEMLDAYVRQRVSDLTQGRQTPVAATSENAQAFPITLR